MLFSEELVVVMMRWNDVSEESAVLARCGLYSDGT